MECLLEYYPHAVASLVSLQSHFPLTHTFQFQVNDSKKLEKRKNKSGFNLSQTWN
jgi:hypothetical protein